MNRAFLAGLIAAATLAGVAMVFRQTRGARNEGIAELQKRIARLEHEGAEARTALSKLGQDRALAELDLRRLEALQAEIDVMHQARQARMGEWLSRVAKLRQALAAHPELSIPEIQLLSDEAWLRVVRNEPTDGDLGLRRALAAVRTSAKHSFARELADAFRRYSNENGGAFPTAVEELRPYVQSAAGREALSRYSWMPADASADPAAGRKGLTERIPIDPDFDSRAQIFKNGSFGMVLSEGAWIEGFDKAAAEAVRVYRERNPHSRNWSMSDLLPHLALEPAKLERLRERIRMRELGKK